jgi:hypothetical protein
VAWTYRIPRGEEDVDELVFDQLRIPPCQREFKTTGWIPPTGGSPSEASKSLSRRCRSSEANSGDSPLSRRLSRARQARDILGTRNRRRAVIGSSSGSFPSSNNGCVPQHHDRMQSASSSQTQRQWRRHFTHPNRPNLDSATHDLLRFAQSLPQPCQLVSRQILAPDPLPCDPQREVAHGLLDIESLAARRQRGEKPRDGDDEVGGGDVGGMEEWAEEGTVLRSSAGCSLECDAQVFRR